VGPQPDLVDHHRRHRDGVPARPLRSRTVLGPGLVSEQDTGSARTELAPLVPRSGRNSIRAIPQVASDSPASTSPTHVAQLETPHRPAGSPLAPHAGGSPPLAVPSRPSTSRKRFEHDVMRYQATVVAMLERYRQPSRTLTVRWTGAVACPRRAARLGSDGPPISWLMPAG
jgi:hypothetical protein